jgi:hypothetical protein
LRVENNNLDETGRLYGTVDLFEWAVGPIWFSNLQRAVVGDLGLVSSLVVSIDQRGKMADNSLQLSLNNPRDLEDRN